MALCSTLYGVISAIYFGLAGYGFHSISTVVLLGRLTLASGICVMTAGVWNNLNYRRLPLVLNGFACTALGLVLIFWKGPLAFRTIALFISIMAVILSVHTLAAVRTLKHSHVDELLLKAAGVISIFFASIFSAFLFHWLSLDPRAPGEGLRWLGSFFGFCAIYTLGLPLRAYIQSGKGKSLPPSAAGFQTLAS